jgi:hypothetical protein
VLFTGIGTAVAMAEDLEQGLIDRLHQQATLGRRRDARFGRQELLSRAGGGAPAFAGRAGATSAIPPSSGCRPRRDATSLYVQRLALHGSVMALPAPAPAQRFAVERQRSSAPSP